MQLRALLRAKERFLERADEIAGLLGGAIINSLSAITAALPPLETSTTTLTAPVTAFIGSVPQLVNSIIANTIDEQLRDLGLCHELYQTLERNVQEASGIQPGTDSKSR